MEGNTDESGLPQRRALAHRPGGLQPKDVLSPEQYASYKRGLNQSGLLAFVGGLCVVVGIMKLDAPVDNPSTDAAPTVYYVGCLVGLAGVAGGTAALLGSRVWSRLGYIFAVPLVVGFPIGTIISILWMAGRSPYLDACEQFEHARAEAAEQIPWPTDLNKKEDSGTA